MAERRRRQKISQEDKERLIRSFEEPDQDYLTVADTLGVNRSTARGIIARYIRENRTAERPRGGRNNVIVNDEMKQCLEAIVNENCTLTLEAINTKLQDRLPEMPTDIVLTIAMHLYGIVVDLKIVLPTASRTQ